MDALSHMMQTLRMRTALYGSVRLQPPWGVGIPRVNAAAFHAVIFGQCWLRLDDEGTWFKLAPSDVVILPHGHAHSFCDEQDSPIRVLDHISADLTPAQLPPVSLDPPVSDPAQTAVLCGHLWFDDRTANPLIAMLPPVLHFRAAHDGCPHGWLEPMLQSVAWENQAQAPGADAILARLGDVIVIQAIRAHLAQLTDGGGGWLHALADPQLGQALGLIHQHPETPWTVPRLAAHVGLSRSTFSEHFTDLVGEPPQRYTTRWRMHHAQRLLREANTTVAAVARRVGYQTEPAFSRAFTRWVGITPGAFKRDDTQHIRPAASLHHPTGPEPH